MDQPQQPQPPTPPVPAGPDAPPSRPPFNELSVLFPILTLYTAGYMALLAAEFFLGDNLRLPGGMMPVYITLLGAYAADKEVRRWAGAPEPPRKGSLFVYLWLVLFLILFVISTFQDALEVPADLGKIVIQVVVVFFGSRASKYVHARRGSGTEDPDVASRQQARVLALFQAQQKVTRADAAAALGVSVRTAGRLLKELADQGVIRGVGEGRGAHYVLVTTQDPGLKLG